MSAQVAGPACAGHSGCRAEYLEWPRDRQADSRRFHARRSAQRAPTVSCTGRQCAPTCRSKARRAPRCRLGCRGGCWCSAATHPSRLAYVVRRA